MLIFALMCFLSSVTNVTSEKSSFIISSFIMLLRWSEYESHVRLYFSWCIVEAKRINERILGQSYSYCILIPKTKWQIRSLQSRYCSQSSLFFNLVNSRLIDCNFSFQFCPPLGQRKIYIDICSLFSDYSGPWTSQVGAPSDVTTSNISWPTLATGKGLLTVFGTTRFWLIRSSRSHNIGPTLHSILTCLQPWILILGLYQVSLRSRSGLSQVFLRSFLGLMSLWAYFMGKKEP